MTLGAAVGDNTTVYEIIFYLHILAAIVGYGGVMLNGLYAQQGMTKPAAQNAAITAANTSVSNVAQIFIYGNFVLGLIMVIMADSDIVAFDQAWLSASMLLWIIAIGLSHGVMKPSVKAYTADLVAQAEGREPGSTGADLEALGKKMGATGAALNLMVVVILYLMVFKPGV